MNARHKKEMDNEPDPVKREALKKKHDEERENLRKKHDDEKERLRKKHDDEQEDFKKRAQDNPANPSTPQAPMLPGAIGTTGALATSAAALANGLGDFGNGNSNENNSSERGSNWNSDGGPDWDPNDGPDDRNPRGPNGEECVDISEDGVCTLADGRLVMPDGSIVLPDGTVIPPGENGYNSNVGFMSQSEFSKINIQNAANICRSVGIDSKILGNGEFVMNCPIEIDNNEYSGPKTPYQYKIPFEVDARSRFLITQFMTHSPSSGFRYYKVYGKNPQEIEKSIQLFSKFQETINSPRGKFIGSLKEEISVLKSSLEKTQGELEDLENDFEELEPTYKENAADYIQLLQAKVASLSEQLAAALRIRSRGMK